MCARNGVSLNHSCAQNDLHMCWCLSICQEHPFTLCREWCKCVSCSQQHLGPNLISLAIDSMKHHVWQVSWVEVRGKKGFKIYHFRLKRLSGQANLPENVVRHVLYPYAWPGLKVLVVLLCIPKHIDLTFGAEGLLKRILCVTVIASITLQLLFCRRAWLAPHSLRSCCW